MLGRAVPAGMYRWRPCPLPIRKLPLLPAAPSRRVTSRRLFRVLATAEEPQEQPQPEKRKRGRPRLSDIADGTAGPKAPKAPKAAKRKASPGQGLLGSLQAEEFQQIDQSVLDELRQKAAEEAAVRALQPVDEEADPKRYNYHRLLLTAASNGFPDRAEQILLQMTDAGLEPGPRAWHVLIYAYVRAQDNAGAMATAQRAVTAGQSLLPETYVVLIFALMRESPPALEPCFMLLEAAEEDGAEPAGAWLMLCRELFRRGETSLAMQLTQEGFAKGYAADNMLGKFVVEQLAAQGLKDRAMQQVQALADAGLRPTADIYNPVLRVTAQQEGQQAARQLLRGLSEDPSFGDPDTESWNALLDGMVDSMDPTDPEFNPDVWRSDMADVRREMVKAGYRNNRYTYKSQMEAYVKMRDAEGALGVLEALLDQGGPGNILVLDPEYLASLMVLLVENDQPADVLKLLNDMLDASMNLPAACSLPLPGEDGRTVLTAWIPRHIDRMRTSRGKTVLEEVQETLREEARQGKEVDGVLLGQGGAAVDEEGVFLKPTKMSLVELKAELEEAGEQLPTSLKRRDLVEMVKARRERLPGYVLEAQAVAAQAQKEREESGKKSDAKAKSDTKADTPKARTPEYNRVFRFFEGKLAQVYVVEQAYKVEAALDESKSLLQRIISGGVDEGVDHILQDMDSTTTGGTFSSAVTASPTAKGGSSSSSGTGTGSSSGGSRSGATGGKPAGLAAEAGPTTAAAAAEAGEGEEEEEVLDEEGEEGEELDEGPALGLGTFDEPEDEGGPAEDMSSVLLAGDEAALEGAAGGTGGEAEGDDEEEDALSLDKMTAANYDKLADQYFSGDVSDITIDHIDARALNKTAGMSVALAMYRSWLLLGGSPSLADYETLIEGVAAGQSLPTARTLAPHMYQLAQFVQPGSRAPVERDTVGQLYVRLAQVCMQIGKVDGAVTADAVLSRAELRGFQVPTTLVAEVLSAMRGRPRMRAKLEAMGYDPAEINLRSIPAPHDPQAAVRPRVEDAGDQDEGEEGEGEGGEEGEDYEERGAAGAGGAEPSVAAATGSDARRVGQSFAESTASLDLVEASAEQSAPGEVLDEEEEPLWVPVWLRPPVGQGAQEADVEVLPGTGGAQSRAQSASFGAPGWGQEGEEGEEGTEAEQLQQQGSEQGPADAGEGEEEEEEEEEEVEDGADVGSDDEPEPGYEEIPLTPEEAEANGWAFMTPAELDYVTLATGALGTEEMEEWLPQEAVEAAVAQANQEVLEDGRAQRLRSSVTAAGLRMHLCDAGYTEEEAEEVILRELAHDAAAWQKYNEDREAYHAAAMAAVMGAAQPQSPGQDGQAGAAGEEEDSQPGPAGEGAEEEEGAEREQGPQQPRQGWGGGGAFDQPLLMSQAEVEAFMVRPLKDASDEQLVQRMAQLMETCATPEEAAQQLMEADVPDLAAAETEAEIDAATQRGAARLEAELAPMIEHLDRELGQAMKNLFLEARGAVPGDPESYRIAQEAQDAEYTQVFDEELQEMIDVPIDPGPADPSEADFTEADVADAVEMFERLLAGLQAEDDDDRGEGGEEGGGDGDGDGSGDGGLGQAGELVGARRP